MRKTKKNKFGKILKNHFLLTLAIIVFYIALGSFLGWDLLSADIKNKKQVAGSTVSALMRIIGPPVTPVLSGQSVCSTENEPYIRLSWNADPDADEYDLYRNKELLMTGITDNFWSDLNVSKNKRYTYYLIAKGPEGTAVSDELVVTAIGCISVANPKVWVEKINDKVVDNSGKKPEINPGRPVFIGQTNISRAKMELEIVGGEQTFYATTQANNNGYWHWVSPNFLDIGEYELGMEALDIKDEELFARNSLTFLVTKEREGDEEGLEGEIKKAESEEGLEPQEIEEAIIASKKNKPKESKEIIQIEIPSQAIREKKPFDFEVDFSQDLQDIFIEGVIIEEEVFRGEDLEIGIIFSEEMSNDLNAQINYRVISQDGKVLLDQADWVKIGPNLKINRKIEVPYSWQTGEYKLQVNVAVGDTAVSNEDYFILKDRPLMRIGAGYLTYDEIIGKLSWVIIICLNFLFIFILLAIWEHHLTRRAIIQVTEKVLRRKGFVS
ncbi:MAG: hypothetical protein V3574_03690 [Candidatus Moraniibacteriota bacterium]